MSLLKDIWNAVSGIGKGMGKVQAEYSEPTLTELYPFVQPQLPPVSVQSLALIKDEDGTDRCVSCLACEKICPSQVITIERKRNPAGKGFILERFDIDMVNCMYCAMCVEVCPASAIVTVQDFEMSTFNLQTLKFDKDFLDEQGLRAMQWYSPKFGVEYREPDPANPIHGKIGKAPLSEQPGGLEAMLKEEEKAKAAALAAASPISSAASPATTAPRPEAPAAPRPAAPTTPAPGVEAPAAPSAPVTASPPAADRIVVTPAETAPSAAAAPTETAASTASAPEAAGQPGTAPDPNRVRKPTKRWEPKNKPFEGDGMPAEKKDGEA